MSPRHRDDLAVASETAHPPLELPNDTLAGRAQLQPAVPSEDASISEAQLVTARRQLIIVMMITVGANLFYFTLYKTVWSDIATRFGQTVSLTQTGVSLVLAGLLWRTPLNAPTLAWLGLGYQVLLCFALALSTHWHLHLHDYQHPPEMASWVCVVMLLFPLLVPASFGKTMVAAVLCAVADSTAFVVAMTVSGQEPPPDMVVLGLLLPPYIVAVMVILPTKVLRALRREARAARQLGSYRLEALLGKGGMGEVWRARHRLLARPAAVKVIAPQLVADSSSAAEALFERFEREAQSTAMLRSPHTVEVYDFGRSPDGTFYYVMELLEGVDLKELVEREGPLPEERALRILIQACDSLDEAHTHGLIHRDIKPANLFITRYGNTTDVLKVLDFGLAKGAAGSKQGVELTGGMQVIGTPAFLAPEVAQGKQNLDGRADLYALGCVAFWLLTGRHVFEGDSPMVVASMHLQSPASAPSSVSPNPISAALDAIVLRCLEKDPAKRPPSAANLQAHLEALTGTHAGPAMAP